MNAETYRDYRRISKAKARKAFKHTELLIAPVNINMHYAIPLYFTVPADSNDECDFDTFCNAIVYYNCNSETGRYLKYFMKE